MNITVRYRVRGRAMVTEDALALAADAKVANVVLKVLEKTKALMHFTFGEIPLLDVNRTLASYGVVDGSVITEVETYRRKIPEPGATIQIFLYDANGQDVSLTVAYTDTIKSIKERCEEKSGIPHENIILIFSKKRMCDDDLVMDYDVTDGSSIMYIRISCA
jgi:hypothetical protein